jgi:hypothetical protein
MSRERSPTPPSINTLVWRHQYMPISVLALYALRASSHEAGYNILRAATDASSPLTTKIVAHSRRGWHTTASIAFTLL